jgi:hypothetical protein
MHPLNFKLRKQLWVLLAVLAIGVFFNFSNWSTTEDILKVAMTAKDRAEIRERLQAAAHGLRPEEYHVQRKELEHKVLSNR